MKRDPDVVLHPLAHCCLGVGMALTLFAATPVRAGDEGPAAYVGATRQGGPGWRGMRMRQAPPSAIVRGRIFEMPDIGYDEIPQMPWPFSRPAAAGTTPCEDDCGDPSGRSDASGTPKIAATAKPLGHRGIECLAGCYALPGVTASR